MPIPSIKEIKGCIPPHCFHRSLLRSVAMLLRDGVIIFVLLCFGFCIPCDTLGVFNCALWFVYSFLSGTAWTGWWVLAHECGHGSFSPYQSVNDVIGFVLHTILLVPYFSWQYSHGKHHAKTNHLLDGESHVPGTYKAYERLGHDKLHSLIGEDAFAVYEIFTHLVLGWPAYLLFNTTGGRRTSKGEPIKGKHMDHFRPSSELFPQKLRLHVGFSTLGIVAWIAFLIRLAFIWGGRQILLLYVGPYLWTNAWLVLYTWMQHTHPAIPHYGEDEWSWVKGALCTIDRPYTGVDWMHHHIGSTHVCHHLFPKIPCYHAVEATRHLKEFLGCRYNYDGRNIIEALYDTAKKCHCVKGVEGEQYMCPVYSKRNKTVGIKED